MINSFVKSAMNQLPGHKSISCLKGSRHSATCATSTVAREQALEWLQALGATAPHWAARFVWGDVTFGVHVAQRAEAMQQQIKARLKNNATVCELTTHTEQVNHRNRDSGAVNEQILAMRQSAQQHPTSA